MGATPRVRGSCARAGLRPRPIWAGRTRRTASDDPSPGIRGRSSSLASSPRQRNVPPVNASLVASGLGAAYAERTLFADLDLVLAPGDVVGLVGGNGAG